MTAITGWRYHDAAISSCIAPHETVDIAPIRDGRIWKVHRALFATWETDFDCPYETDFWHTILDHPFSIEALRAKERYEIKKGLKNFYTRVLTEQEIGPALYDVYLDSLSGYRNAEPQKEADFLRQWKSIQQGPDCVLMGVFDRTDDRICGFAQMNLHGRWIPISVFTTRVTCEKRNVNFALMHGIVTEFDTALRNGAYLDDGSRNVLHETNFQSWLIRYFGFRRAYSLLNIRYRFPINWIIPVIYRCRGALGLLPEGCSLVRKARGLMRMEQWRRNGLKQRALHR